MRILVIDPVTSKGLQGDKAYLQSVADAETEVEVVGLKRGPKSIETFYDATQVVDRRGVRYIIKLELESYTIKQREDNMR
jgi:Asp/Glu/hydantoin racemase